MVRKKKRKLFHNCYDLGRRRMIYFCEKSNGSSIIKNLTRLCKIRCFCSKGMVLLSKGNNLDLTRCFWTTINRIKIRIRSLSNVYWFGCQRGSNVVTPRSYLVYSLFGFSSNSFTMKYGVTSLFHS